MEIAQMNCLQCDAETFPDDKFCQDCGMLLDCRKSGNIKPPFAFLPGLDKWYDAAKNVVRAKSKRFWVLSLVLSSFAVAVVFYLWQASSTNRNMFERAYSAFSKGDWSATITEIEKMRLANNGSLAKAEQSLLNRALSNRSEQYALLGNYRGAMSDLLRISPEYEQYKCVLDQIDAYSYLLFAHRSRNHSSFSKRQKTRHFLSSDPKSPSLPSSLPSGSNIARLEKNIDSNSTKSMHHIALRTTVSAPSGERNSDRDEEPGDENERATKIITVQQSETSKEIVPYDDVAQYNKLLASYFSNEQASGTTAKNKSKGTMEVHEPLSFKEWVTAGKPDF